MGKFTKEFADRLKGMFSDDESGAESSEVILVLVLLVVGLIGAWGFLRKKLSDKSNSVGNCIDKAGTSTATTTC